MTDKDKEKLHQILSSLWKNDDSVGKTYYNQALQDVQTAIDLHEEPVSEDKMAISKEWFEHCKKSWYNEGYIDGKYNRDRQFEEPVSKDLEKIVEEIAEPTILNAYGTKELARRLRNTICGTSVSEDLEEASKNYALNNTPWDDCKDEIQESFKAGAKWQKEKDESITEDLGEYINELSKQFQEVSFAKLSRIAVRVSRWQKEQMKNTLEPDTPATAEEIKKMQDKRRYELQKKVQHEYNSQLQEQYDNGYDDGYKDAEKVAYEKVRQQVIDKAVDGTARPDDNEIWCNLASSNLKDGDKVKVIIIKEG